MRCRTMLQAFRPYGRLSSHQGMQNGMSCACVQGWHANLLAEDCPVVLSLVWLTSHSVGLMALLLRLEWVT
jgi:hypothetical protein